MLSYLLGCFFVIENKYTEILSNINISSFKTFIKLFKERKSTAVLLLEETFFEESDIKGIKNNQGDLKDYEHILVVINMTTQIGIQKSCKYGGFPTKGNAKKAFKEIIDFCYKGEMKTGLLGTNFTYTDGKISFILPNIQIDWKLDIKYKYILDNNANKSEMKLFALALEFSKYYDTYISGFNPILYNLCTQSEKIKHLNPRYFNKGRISYDNFEKALNSKL